LGEAHTISGREVYGHRYEPDIDEWLPVDQDGNLISVPLRGLELLRAKQRLKRAMQRFRPTKSPTLQRSTKRAPRTQKRTTKAVASTSEDGPPEPPSCSGQPVGALVTQLNSGLPRRQYLALVREKGIPCAKVGRLVVVRYDHLLAALGLADAPVAPVEEVSRETVIRLIRGGK
jgi:hypothetical protein